MTAFIQPGSPEHMRLITPSKVAAILGVSRYTSAYKLWHQMNGTVPPNPPSDIFQAGHDFEAAMDVIWRRENPDWRLSRGEVQVSNGTLPFPNLATLDRRASRGRTRRVVEFKTARDLSAWGDDFTDAAPADYVAQVQAQMLITGWTSQPAHLMVLGPFFQHHTYEIPFDAGIADAIVKACVNFHESLIAGVAPGLDDTVATYETVRQLHPDIDGTSVEVPAALAVDFLNADAELKEVETLHRGLKTQLLDAMGNAATATTPAGIKVATRSPGTRGAVALRLNRKALTELTEGATA